MVRRIINQSKIAFKLKSVNEILAYGPLEVGLIKIRLNVIQSNDFNGGAEENRVGKSSTYKSTGRSFIVQCKSNRQ